MLNVDMFFIEELFAPSNHQEILRSVIIKKQLIGKVRL